MLTATSGLCAAAYLVLRHTAAVTAPTVLGAVGFTAAGLAAMSLPFQLGSDDHRRRAGGIVTLKTATGVLV